MEYNSPLGHEKERTLISILELTPDSNVLEVGCGNGRFIIKVLETYGAKGLGVDINEELISDAIGFAEQSLEPSQFTFLAKDIGALDNQPDTYDLLICNGSSHAFGVGLDAYKNTLSQAYTLLKVGGLLLIGEGYWKKQPEQAYLDLIGEPIGIYNDFKGNITQAEDHGFRTLYAASSNQDEWDNFEWNHNIRNRSRLKNSPNNPDLKSKQEHLDKWLNGYLTWGRNTMGYGFYLLEKALH